MTGHGPELTGLSEGPKEHYYYSYIYLSLKGQDHGPQVIIIIFFILYH